jgi:hypothetical protein
MKPITPQPFNLDDHAEQVSNLALYLTKVFQEKKPYAYKIKFGYSDMAESLISISCQQTYHKLDPTLKMQRSALYVLVKRLRVEIDAWLQSNGYKILNRYRPQRYKETEASA